MGEFKANAPVHMYEEVIETMDDEEDPAFVASSATVIVSIWFVASFDVSCCNEEHIVVRCVTAPSSRDAPY